MSYQTKSLPLASFLYSKTEVNLIDVDKKDTNNIFFQFEPEDVVEKLVDNYYTAVGDNGNIKRYVEAQKSLKDLIFEIKRQNS